MKTGPNSARRIVQSASVPRGVAVRSSSKKMRQSTTGQHTANWWEHEVQKAGTLHCSTCGSAYFDGHWHTLPVTARRIVRTVARGASCPACAAERAKRPHNWEGEFILRGVGLAHRAEVLAVIRNFGARARTRNIESRILDIDARGKDMMVHTTQNQLAVRIAKKVDESFKGGSLDIQYGNDDLPVRVRWQAPSSWQT